MFDGTKICLGILILGIAVFIGVVLTESIDMIRWANVEKRIEVSMAYNTDEDREKKVTYCMELFKTNGFIVKSVDIDNHNGISYVTCIGQTNSKNK